MFPFITFVAKYSRSLLIAATFVVAATPPSAAQSPPKSFVLHETPKSIATIVFADGDGHALSLADVHGKVVLLNIWATWCGPCRREMPALDRLQTLLGGPDFEVIALSIDRAGIDVVRKFYANVGIKTLSLRIDTAGKAPRELATVGVPATLLIGRDGRELGRLVGPAEWDDPNTVQFLKRIIEQKRSAAKPPNGLTRATAEDHATTLSFARAR